MESRRGLGMFVNGGARKQLLAAERKRFLAEEWPRVAETIERLGLDAAGSSRARGGTRRKKGALAMAVIEAHNLRKVYRKTVALDGMDLTRRAGPHPRI